MRVDPTYRHVTHTTPALGLLRVGSVAATVAVTLGLTAAALVDTGAEEVVDWAVNGQWDAWLRAGYIVAGLASVPFTIAGWVLVTIHVTRRKA